MVEGIILAGGYSSRAKQNKMLLRFNDKPLIFYTVMSLLPFVNHLIVVTGHYDLDIRQALRDFPQIEIVRNSNYDKGMFSSILCGVKKIHSDILILPGDCPFIKNETIVSLLNGIGDIRIPEYKNKHGHPIYISRSLVEELKKEPVDYNLKAFRNCHNYEIIETTDKNILNDIDTLNDYQDLNKNLEGK
ncbi:MAG: nucleotidyltransferase family protein [Bacilli bacterium]